MPRLLVIEDDDAIQKLLKDTLEQAHYEVVSAFSGTEGLLRFEQDAIDLVLLDLMLPGMPGEQVIQAIRNTSNVPVIVLSAKADTDSKLLLLTTGADDYVTKPFNLDELLARISIQLRHAQPRESGLNYQDISIDPETHATSVNGQALQLTAREFELLQLFLAHPHKVFSRANIYETVWGEPYFESDKTINVHISNLRQKLKASGADYIRTVWGVGFKFD